MAQTSSLAEWFDDDDGPTQLEEISAPAVMATPATVLAYGLNNTVMVLHRTFPIAATSADTLSFSFSSETPVARSFGMEVLIHGPGAADLSRLNDGAALLWNHDPGALLGVIEKAQISSGKGRAVARWGSSPEAQQRRADVEAGIIRNVSAGAGTLPLTGGEQGRYSLINAIRAAATGDWSNAGFERECSRTLEQQTGRAARRWWSRWPRASWPSAA
jgi:hypothetical protein